MATEIVGQDSLGLGQQQTRTPKRTVVRPQQQQREDEFEPVSSDGTISAMLDSDGMLYIRVDTTREPSRSQSGLSNVYASLPKNAMLPGGFRAAMSVYKFIPQARSNAPQPRRFSSRS